MAVSSLRAVVVIPTFNEAENLSRLLPKLLELKLDILIVDDSSSDRTQEVVRDFKFQSNRVELLARTAKMGLGSAYRDGFAQVLNRDYEVVIQMDADGSHRVADLHRMIERLQSDSRIELLIGSRWVQGGAVQNWPKHREILSRTANFYSKMMLGLTVRDSTSGFRIYRADLLKKMKLNLIESEGYAFQIEMTRAATNAGAQIAEIPITFIEREFGVSKMSPRIVREALIKVTKWGITRILRKS